MHIDTTAELRNRVPENILHSLDLYVSEGIAPGSCTLAILSNDLQDAYGRADPTTAAAMQDIVRYIYNCLPSDAWGSREKVIAWIDATRAAKTMEPTP